MSELVVVNVVKRYYIKNYTTEVNWLKPQGLKRNKNKQTRLD